MRIVIASATDAGILRVRSELISELLHAGNEVVAVAPKGNDYLKLERLGCEFVSVTIDGHGMNPFADFSVYKQFIKILKSIKPDIVFLFTTKSNVYGGMACRKLKIPVVMNITGMGMALGNRGILQIVLIQLYKCACNGKNIRKIFFQNDDSKAFFIRHEIGNPLLFQRIPGSGVNLKKFTVQPFPSSETIDFLFIARVMKQKGIDQYIEAAKKIREKYPEAVFHVLGDCDEEYKEKLYRENEKGTVVFHGRVNNIHDFQKMSQCTVQPSYYPEGMSNVILEAAASGRPVITTDHPGCREGVDDGISGYIVPVRDSEALTEAIEKFLKLTRDERIEMGLCGRRKMEREFDREIVTDAYIRILKG